MEVKRKNKMLLAAIIVQLIALAIVIVATCMQKDLNAYLVENYEELAVDVVPLEAYILVCLLLMIYSASIIVTKVAKEANLKVLLGIFVTLAIVVFGIVPSFRNTITLAVTNGAVSMVVSYNSLMDTIRIIAMPFIVVAFGLFCMGCGRYFVNKEGINNN